MKKLFTIVVMAIVAITTQTYAQRKPIPIANPRFDSNGKPVIYQATEIKDMFENNHGLNGNRDVIVEKILEEVNIQKENQGLYPDEEYNDLYAIFDVMVYNPGNEGDWVYTLGLDPYNKDGFVEVYSGGKLGRPNNGGWYEFDPKQLDPDFTGNYKPIIVVYAACINPPNIKRVTAPPVPTSNEEGTQKEQNNSNDDLGGDYSNASADASANVDVNVYSDGGSYDQGPDVVYVEQSPEVILVGGSSVGGGTIFSASLGCGDSHAYNQPVGPSYIDQSQTIIDQHVEDNHYEDNHYEDNHVEDNDVTHNHNNNGNNNNNGNHSNNDSHNDSHDHNGDNVVVNNNGHHIPHGPGTGNPGTGGPIGAENGPGEGWNDPGTGNPGTGNPGTGNPGTGGNDDEGWNIPGTIDGGGYTQNPGTGSSGGTGLTYQNRFRTSGNSTSGNQNTPSGRSAAHQQNQQSQPMAGNTGRSGLQFKNRYGNSGTNNQNGSSNRVSSQRSTEQHQNVQNQPRRERVQYRDRFTKQSNERVAPKNMQRRSNEYRAERRQPQVRQARQSGKVAQHQPRTPRARAGRSLAFN